MVPRLGAAAVSCGIAGRIRTARFYCRLSLAPRKGISAPAGWSIAVPIPPDIYYRVSRWIEPSSANIPDAQKAKLKSLFPEVFTEHGTLDFERLKLTLGESVDAGKERYGMSWPGKTDCFKTIQRPSMATLVPAPNESVNFEATENLIIEGDRHTSPLPAGIQCSLTTMPEMLDDPLGPIWIRPVDYMEVIACSGHETDKPRHLGRYPGRTGYRANHPGTCHFGGTRRLDRLDAHYT